MHEESKKFFRGKDLEWFIMDPKDILWNTVIGRFTKDWKDFLIKTIYSDSQKTQKIFLEKKCQAIHEESKLKSFFAKERFTKKSKQLFAKNNLERIRI
jgi:hypothetical protein